MNPQVQEAIDNINQFIVENHNNEITADVLNPILIEIANLWGELVGDLSDSSVDGDTIIEMINQLQQNIEDVTGLTVHTGQPDPNVTPPTTYSAPDLYVRLTPSNIPYEVYIYNGIRWVLIDSGITKISEQWASYVLTGIGGLPILPQINENNRNINITGNPSGLSSLGGFVASGGASIANFWDGMTAKVLNSSPNSQTIKHNYSGADIKYLFPNEEDYTIRPNEVVYFDLKGGNLVFRYSTFLNAKNVFFDNTGTVIDANDVEEAIKELRGLDLNDFTNDTPNRYIRLDETLVKLEESMTFTVGVGKDFETIEEAIDQALNYYPNADYKITILIDEGYEINTNIFYQGLDFSHIIIKTTGVITVNPALTGIVIRFENCWLPIFDEFYINGHTSVSYLFYFQTSFASLITNSEISGFPISIAYNGVFSARISNTIIEVPAVNLGYGINVQNSYVRTDGNTQIISLNTANLNINTRGVFANAGSFLSMSGTVLGNFRHALYAEGATISSGTQTLEATQEHLFVNRCGIIFNRNTGTLTSNIPLNTLTGKGLILNENKSNPINFDGTDYFLDYIKAPSGQEYNVTVDDTGKLISEPKPDLSNSSEITSGTTALTATSQVNVYYFNGTSLKDVFLPKPSEAIGKEIIIINNGTANVIAHSWDDSPVLLIVNKLDYSNQAVTKPNNIGKFICDGNAWTFTTVNNFEVIAEEGKTVVMTVLPDGTPQAEEIMELWVYDDTTTSYSLSDLQTNYPTSAGRNQGFEVRCRLLTPPTTYRKESENDSLWIKIEGSNVV